MKVIGIDKIIPEISSFFAIFVLVIMSILKKKKIERNTFFVVGILFSIISLLLTLFLYGRFDVHYIFYNIMVFDGITMLFRTILYLLLFFILLFSIRSREVDDYLVPEYIMLLFGVVIACVFLVGSVNLLMIYLTIETIGVLSYFLTGFIPKDKRATEGALKYAYFGAISSSVMIFGMSFIYGITGSFDLKEIGAYLVDFPIENKELLILAFILVIAGFSYKISAFPFHSWCPDAYEAAPTPITAFFTIGPKLAGISVFIRFFNQYLKEAMYIKNEVVFFIAIISAFTVIYGTFVALKQTNIKRLLAYSSISHAGYMLMGIVVFSHYGVEAVMFYVLAYFFMSLGAFSIVILVVNNWNTEMIEDYKGFAWHNRKTFLLAVLFSIFLFSLTGIPPLVGFIAKWYVLVGLINKKVYWLAIVLILNSVVSFYYYAGIVKKMVFDYKDIKPRKIFSDSIYTYTAIIMAFFVVLFGVYFAPLFDYFRKITESIGL